MSVRFTQLSEKIGQLGITATLVIAAMLTGCAVKSIKPESAGRSLSFKVKYWGEGCPDEAFWLWGKEERESITRVPLTDCARFGVVGTHSFWTDTPRRVYVGFYENGRLVGSDYLDVMP